MTGKKAGTQSAPDKGQSVKVQSPQSSDVLDGIISKLIEQASSFEAFLRRRLNDEALAKDLLQQSFIRAIQHHHTLRNQESVVAWFYRILRHAIIDYYRSQDAETRRDEALARQMTITGEDTAPAPDAVQATICACLHDVLPQLRPNYAELIRRVDLEGESPEQLAQALKTTANNLTVRLHRARQALRGALEESCGVCSKHGCLNCTCA